MLALCLLVTDAEWDTYDKDDAGNNDEQEPLPGNAASRSFFPSGCGAGVSFNKSTVFTSRGDWELLCVVSFAFSFFGWRLP